MCAWAAGEVSFSNPGKIFFPEKGLTKGDLADYYRCASGSTLWGT